MNDVTNVFVTDEGAHRFSLDSPQVPGLVAGWPTRTELVADCQRVLRDAGVRRRVVGHEQTRGVTPHGVEFLFRRMTGPSEASRLVVANQVDAILTTDAHTDLLDDLEPSATGEFVFVACLATDTIGSEVIRVFDVE